MKSSTDILNSAKSLVSIILTTYNSEAIIEKTLGAIINQNFPLNRVELIIVDGGSKDGTLELIRKFLVENAHHFYDVKLIVHDRNYGVSRARNDGIKLARGNYILILDHDVVMEKDVLRLLYEFLDKTSIKIGGVMPLLVPVTTNLLDKWYVKSLEGRMIEYYGVADCILLRRDIVEKAGYYDESLGPPHTIFEEREYGARIASKGFKIYILGWLKAYHHVGAEQRSPKSKVNTDRFLVRALTTFKSLLDKKYIYGLKKWIRSMPLREKIKWISYSLLAWTFIPLLILSVYTNSSLPLFMWFTFAGFMYLDTLKYYWNPSALHISLAYSLIAFVWRLIRSVVLLIPEPKWTKSKKVDNGTLTRGQAI